MLLRPAADSDGDAVAALRHAWLEETSGCAIDDPGFVARFSQWWATEGSRRLVWLALVDGVAVGMVNVMIFDRMPWPGERSIPTQWGYLANLYVLPAHRSRGIGASLVEACTAYADEHDLARLVLAPSEASVSLYRRAGFGTAEELMLRPRR